MGLPFVRVIVVTALGLGLAACTGGAQAGSSGAGGDGLDGGGSGGTGGSGGWAGEGGSGSSGGSGGEVGSGGEGPGGAGGCLPVETTVLSPVCRADGWCWLDPYPQGNLLHDASGTGPEDIWFVGAQGTALHYGPGGFTLDVVPTEAEIQSVVAIAPDDVWAVGLNAGVLHRDASGWHQVDPGVEASLERVFYSPAAGLWLSGTRGREGVVLRRNADAWEEIPVGGEYPATVLWAASRAEVWVGRRDELRRWTPLGALLVRGPAGAVSISGTGPADVWIVDSTGVVWRWNGERIAMADAPNASRVDVVAADDVWLRESMGGMAHWDGSAWRVLEPPFHAASMWPEGDGKAWIASGHRIARWDGSTWIRFDRRLGPLNSIDVDSRGQIRAVGSGGRVVRLDPRSLEATAVVPEAGAANLYDATARTPDDLWAYRSLEGAVRWNGCRWSTVDPSLEWYADVSSAGGAVFGTARLGSGEEPTLLRHDGDAWTSYPLPGRMTALRALSADEALVAVEEDGSGVVLRWHEGTLTSVGATNGVVSEVLEDGEGVTAVSAIPGDVGLYRWLVLDGTGWLRYRPGSPGGDRREGGEWSDVWGTDPDDVWFATERGDVLHWDGSSLGGRRAWTSWASGPTRLVLAGTDPSDVWMAEVGFDGSDLSRWNGSSFGDLPDLPGEAHALVAFPNGEAWAAGPALWHFDGTAWSVALADVELDALWAAGPGDVWAAGPGGVLLHHDGVAWVEHASGVTDDLVALTGLGTSDLWAVGADGTLLHFDGTAWTRMLEVGHALVGAQAIEDGLWLASSDGTVVRIAGGAVAHEEAIGLAIADMAAFGTSDLWVAGKPADGDGAGSIRHYDGVRWTAHDGGLDWPGYSGPMFRWQGGPWVAGMTEDHDYGGRLVELGPGRRSILVPAFRIGSVRIDDRGDLWCIAMDYDYEPFLLRYRPPAE